MPEDVIDTSDTDVLAGEYVLGTLDPDERAAAHNLISADAAFAAKVKVWERRLGELHLMVEPIEPEGDVWPRIKARLPEPQPQPEPATTLPEFNLELEPEPEPGPQEERAAEWGCRAHLNPPRRPNLQAALPTHLPLRRRSTLRKTAKRPRRPPRTSSSCRAGSPQRASLPLRNQPLRRRPLRKHRSSRLQPPPPRCHRLFHRRQSQQRPRSRSRRNCGRCAGISPAGACWPPLWRSPSSRWQAWSRYGDMRRSECRRCSARWP